MSADLAPPQTRLQLLHRWGGVYRTRVLSRGGQYRHQRICILGIGYISYLLSYSYSVLSDDIVTRYIYIACNTLDGIHLGAVSPAFMAATTSRTAVFQAWRSQSSALWWVPVIRSVWHLHSDPAPGFKPTGLVKCKGTVKRL